ncbi:uncharacterized protein BDW43DRAFT_314937 [Aspergillus alliaceus]|uniref:uncharacterized protein n=1 Tax=Petromyces alliaceus TaxID=209559 RepID=UPI0012A42561|nr:uncharacterized protein BDW43DRAFT_314937 [Aspergillus alliaceus]KAB8229549.1 hypothetical protein BDW43DRAFT_314937 [Aspergillus alliaceus]
MRCLIEPNLAIKWGPDSTFQQYPLTDEPGSQHDHVLLDKTALSASVREKELVVTVYGSRISIAEIGEIHGWLGASLQELPSTSASASSSATTTSAPTSTSPVSSTSAGNPTATSEGGGSSGNAVALGTGLGVGLGVPLLLVPLRFPVAVNSDKETSAGAGYGPESIGFPW